MDGWVKLHRKLSDNPIWFCEKFTRGQAWVDLILLANHQDSYFYKRGVKIDVKRGQVGRSEVELSDRWKWSRSKVRKFLNDLEKEQQIIQQKTNVTQLISIINYDNYQQKEQQTEQQKDTKRTPKEQQKDTYKNDKKEKNVKNDNKKEKVLDFYFEYSFFKDEFAKIWFNEFIPLKKKKKAAVTDRALKSQLKKIAGFSQSNYKTALEILEKSVNSGWTDFYQLKTNGQTQQNEFNHGNLKKF